MLSPSWPLPQLCTCSSPGHSKQTKHFPLCNSTSWLPSASQSLHLDLSRSTGAALTQVRGRSKIHVERGSQKQRGQLCAALHGLFVALCWKEEACLGAFVGIGLRPATGGLRL